MRIAVFDCPYATCVWPACQTDLAEAVNHPLCESAIVEAKSRFLDRYSFRPIRNGEFQPHPAEILEGKP